jgi:hypothetical protein
MSGRTEPPAAFDPVRPAAPQPFDPLRLCIYTTIAALAWLLTPWVVVTVFSGMSRLPPTSRPGGRDWSSRSASSGTPAW